MWVCKCDCGKEIIARGTNLRAKVTKSCGCYAKELKKLPKKEKPYSKYKAYKSWNSMKVRCLNKDNEHYKFYGARGIKICERWLNFKNFLEDMGERPEGKTLDRINVNGNYTKENCRWATPEEQSNNTRKNVKIMYDGKLKTFYELEKITGIKRKKLKNRYYKGKRGNDLFI